MQQRLQTRIEAQGKYFQAILCKAQEGISLDMSCPKTKRDKLKIKNEAAPTDYCSLQLNLNNGSSSNHSYDFGGGHGTELDAKLLAYTP